MQSKIPDQILEIVKPLIKEFEGLRLSKYQDIAGYWTIGYGHRCDADQEDITLEKAELWLDEDITSAYNSLVGWSPSLAPGGQCSATQPGLVAALVDFVYNLGSTRYCRSTLRRLVDAANPLADVAAQLATWHFSEGKSVAGLLRRREAEIALFLPVNLSSS